ncbi:hypothetical protein [Solirubrobacter soli]|uniref:hypothetical protein n=1 Tax=Solirubrobacter soli TaxID=363832 RepID=UPI00042097CA|nr:hypothetical protein [Solirubrobacter soli]
MDADDDPGFDSARDATGCDVENQDPTAGEMVDDTAEVQITVSCAQVDWENQEGTAWEAFSDAYTTGFDDGCQALFDESPNGSLYENDDEYSAVDCQNENPGDASNTSALPDDVPDDPDAAGREAGELDGCIALFDNQAVTSLNYGPDSWTRDDCPIGASVVAPAPTPRPKSQGRRSKRAGERCSGQQTDGTRISIRVSDGEVRCTGAEALWNEYLRRAPNEGLGSGAALELEGWSCIAATAAQAPRSGSCSAKDGSGAFTVFARA